MRAAILDNVKAKGKQVLYRLLPDPLLVRFFLGRMPHRSQIEVTSACNLKCPLCITHQVRRRTQWLREDYLRDVLESCGGVLKSVTLNMQGDALMHPRIFKLVKMCEDAGANTHMFTNGMLLDRRMDELFESRLSAIVIALDGYDAESYSRYRKNGDFDQVVANVRKLVAEKRRLGSDRPVIEVQTVMFSYNEPKEKEILEFLNELGADRVALKPPSYFFLFDPGPDVDVDVSPEQKAAAREFLDGVHPEQQARKYQRAEDTNAPTLFRNQRICPQFEQLNVLSDGRVVGCCSDHTGKEVIGDLSQQSLKEIWTGPERKRLLERFQRRELPLCSYCPLGPHRRDDALEEREAREGSESE